MRKSIVSILVMLAFTSSGYAVVIGDFETGFDGWYNDEWTQGTLTLSTTGATLGSQAVMVETPGGWKQGGKVDVKAHRDWLAMPGAQITADITSFAADMTGGWAEVKPVINGQSYDDGAPHNNIGWQDVFALLPMDRTGEPQSMAWTVPEDLSAKIAGVDDGIHWFEIVLVVNTEDAPGSVGKLYMDNVQVIPEPATLLLLGLGGLALRRRK